MNKTIEIVLICIFSIYITHCAQSAAGNNDMPTKEWSAEKKKSLPSSERIFEAFVWQHMKNRDSKSNITSQQLVYVPANGLLWCGRPTQNMFITDKKIVGVYSAGGNLYLISSPSKIIESNLLPKHVDLSKYSSTRPIEWNFETTGDKIIGLGDIIGEQYLQDIKLARPPRPVQINNITCDKSNIVISMTSEIGTKIVLVINDKFSSISATVDGKSVFPKVSEP